MIYTRKYKNWIYFWNIEIENLIFENLRKMKNDFEKIFRSNIENLKIEMKKIFSYYKILGKKISPIRAIFSEIKNFMNENFYSYFEKIKNFFSVNKQIQKKSNQIIFNECEKIDSKNFIKILFGIEKESLIKKLKNNFDQIKDSIKLILDNFLQKEEFYNYLKKNNKININDFSNFEKFQK